MFDISWAELGILTAVGVAVVGRKDLPWAARQLGYYSGKGVGWIMGMRSRADRFTSQHELAQLQGQVRTGMRQLQAVQAELLSASSGRAFLSHQQPGAASWSAAAPTSPTSPYLNVGGPLSSLTNPATSAISAAVGVPPSTPLTSGATNLPNLALPPTEPLSSPPHSTALPPASRSIAAVAESEWVRQGLGFTSRAEGAATTVDGGSPGSVVLARALQESLVYDQYDRVTQEQQQVLAKDTKQHDGASSEKDSSKSK